MVKLVSGKTASSVSLPRYLWFYFEMILLTTKSIREPVIFEVEFCKQLSPYILSLKHAHKHGANRLRFACA